MSKDIYSAIPNKYYKWYCYFILQFQTRVKIKGITHHIEPKSFYLKYAKDGWKLENPNIKSNIVIVTNREHFILHWLLTKCYDGLPKKKMCNAFLRMCKGNKTSKYYSYARNLWQKFTIGSNNHFYGKHHTIETNQIISQKNKGKLAWNKGLQGNKGETNTASKLTENDVKSIKQSYNDKIPINDERIGKTQCNGKIFPYDRAFCFQFGSIYSVSHKTIELIITNQKWTHI